MNREITVPCKNVKMVFLCIPETELGTEIVYQDRPLNCHRFLPKSSCILRRSRESDAAANWILLISFHLCTIKPTFSITRRKSSLSILLAFCRFVRNTIRPKFNDRYCWPKVSTSESKRRKRNSKRKREDLCHNSRSVDFLGMLQELE